jgi:hypothetical protein
MQNLKNVRFHIWQSQNDNREWDHKIVFEIHKLKGVVWRELKGVVRVKISKPLFTAKVGGPQINVAIESPQICDLLFAEGAQ